jgi:hypothetical protein
MQTQPFARRPGESARAFAAFCCYRDLGPKRSLREACRRFYDGETPGKVRQLERWSAAWGWGARAAAWDEELDRQARETQERQRRGMAGRHARLAVACQDKALARLAAMKAEELGPAEVLRYLVEAARLERTAWGEPETVTEQRQKVEARHAPDLFAGIERLAKAIAAEMGAGGGGLPPDGGAERVHPPQADAEAAAGPPAG